ncbi:type II secretion system protein [Pseudomonas sp. GWSMS-1]|uniref:type II secretion system protein n=1 Tax=Pseudomonas sp. GWSMS-1 TaxID=3308997 RepID=UPI003CE8BEF2
MRRNERGFSLLELAIAIAVIGVMAVLLLTFVQRQNLQAQASAQRSLLERADQALTGFVLTHNRLPCADTDGDGLENCGAAGAGVSKRLPARTLGMASFQAAQVRYQVYQAPLPGALDRDLGVAKDRFSPLVAQVVPGAVLATATLLGQNTLLDFCSGLNTGARAPFSAAQVHTVGPAGSTNVAYGLALGGVRDRDGDGTPADGLQAQGVGFDAPTQAHSLNNDDRVRAVGFAQLYARLACSEVLAAAGSAHFNVGTAALTLQRGAIDYAVLQDLNDELAEANVAMGTASTLSAVAGVSQAATDMQIALADSLITYGLMGVNVPIAVIDIVTNAAGVPGAATGLAFAVCAKIGTEALKDHSVHYRDLAIRYTDAIQANAVRGDRAQWWNTVAEVDMPPQVIAPIAVNPFSLNFCSVEDIDVPDDPR